MWATHFRDETACIDWSSAIEFKTKRVEALTRPHDAAQRIAHNQPESIYHSFSGILAVSCEARMKKK